MLRPVPSATEIMHARAEQLLDRYGVLTREMALAEGTQAGFAGVYPVLKAMEEQGQIRRGYFVAGLGAAQFAKPGAVDRLRAHRHVVGVGVGVGVEVGVDMEITWSVLAATDTAQPYGAALSWPDNSGRPARASGALVVMADGTAVVFVDKGGRSIVTFPAADLWPDWVDQLAAVVRVGRRSRFEISKIDGVSPAASPWRQPLLAAGFVDGYRGLVLRH